MAVLVRIKRHMFPMLCVLRRYDIGVEDKYGRGRWIKKSDIESIWTHMNVDSTAIRGRYNGIDYIFVQGSNPHNHVGIDDFKKLFAQKGEDA